MIGWQRQHMATFLANSSNIRTTSRAQKAENMFVCTDAEAPIVLKTMQLVGFMCHILNHIAALAALLCMYVCLNLSFIL